MRKIAGICLSVFFCMGLLSGCSQQTDVETSTVFVEKKGSIVSVDVEKFDKEYYDAEELEKYITERIEVYNKTSGDAVEKSSFDVEEDTAKLKMRYQSFEDYAKFNGIEFFTGTVVAAQAEGYDFDTEFYGVSEKKDGQKDVNGKDILKEDNNKVVVIKANVDVKVDGTVLYVSKQDTKVTAKDTVSIMGEGANEEAALTYIIYN